MITVEFTVNSQAYTLYPQSIDIPDVRGMNSSLQHEEQSCTFTIPFDEDVLALLANNQDVEAHVYDGENVVFSGTVNGDIQWTENGNPEPADKISITIKDNTSLLDVPAESELAMIGENLSDIAQEICRICGVTYSAVFTDNPEITAFVIDKDKKYLEAFNNLLYQHCYSYYFDGSGAFSVIKLNTSSPSETLDDSDFLAGLNISKTKKNYNAVKVSYGTLTKKNNEQVYFEGNGLDSENRVLPITVRPGQYYPYDSDPIQETREGKVYQNFESGYAESYTTYSGETKYRRSSRTTLVYTENHSVVQDWTGNITINRTEFGARSAAVRLLNNGSSDASLMQFAIRADAYYRTADGVVKVGTGKKEYICETEFVYDEETASKLAQLLYRINTGNSLQFSGKLEKAVIPGNIYAIDTGTSGIHTTAIALSCMFNPETQIYKALFLSISEASMNVARYKHRFSNDGTEIIIKSIKIQAPQGLAFVNSEPASLTLTVAASGFVPSSYQWYKDDSAINGSTDASLTVTQKGVYKVVVNGMLFDSATVIAVEDGPAGEKGDSGNGISSIDYYYATTGTQTAPSADSITSTTIPTMSANNKYLWQKEVIHFTDSGAADKVTVALIGVYGDDGTSRETIALTSPSTPSGTYVNQLGAYKGQIYQWNGTVWVKQSSDVNSLINELCLHYSFDELANVPNGNYVYKRNKDWTSVDWSRDNTNFTQSIENSRLKWVWNTTGGTLQVNSYKSNLPNKFMLVKLNAKLSVEGNTYFRLLLSRSGTLQRISNVPIHNGNNEFEIVIPSDVSSTYTIVQITDVKQNDEVLFEYWYIGDGSNTIPVIDNSRNGYNGTNNGIVRTEGMSGKGALFFKGTAETIFNFSNNFSISFWIKAGNTSNNLINYILNMANVLAIKNGDTNKNYVSMILYDDSGNIILNDDVNICPLFSATEFSHFAIVKSGTKIKFFLNGELVNTQTLTTSNIKTTQNNLVIGNSSNTRQATIDDLNIYSKALTDEEVYALYLKNGKLEQNYSYEDYLADQKANLVFSKNPIALNKRRDNKSMYSNYSCYVYMSLVRTNNELYPMATADVVLDTTDKPSYVTVTKDVSDDSNYSVKLTLTFNAYSSGEAVREATNFRIGLTVNGQNGVTYYNYIDVVYNQYGKYVGAIKAINGTGGIRTVTMLDDTTKTISEGDYFVWAGTTDDGNPFYISHLYQFMATNSSTYIYSEYVTDEDVATALGDIGSVIDRATMPNNKGMTYIKNLVSNNAFIKNLFAENITMNDTGIIKSENYNSNVNAYNIRGYWEYIGRNNTTNLHIVVNFPESYTGDIEVQIWKQIEGEGGLVKQDTRYMSNSYSHWTYNLNISNLDPNKYVYKIDIIEPHISTFFYITRSLLSRNPDYEFMNISLDLNGFKIQSNGDASFYGNTLLKGYSLLNNAILQDSLIVLNGSKMNYTIEFSGNYQENTYNDLFSQLAKLNNLLIKYSKLWKNLNSTYCYGLTNITGYFEYKDNDNNYTYYIYFNTSLAEVVLKGNRSELTNNNLVFNCECVNFYIKKNSESPISLTGDLSIDLYFGGTTTIKITTKLEQHFFTMVHNADMTGGANLEYTGYITFAV